MENPSGAVQGNSQNSPTANVPRTRSTFPLGYHMFDTHRFGEYHPHYAEDGVKGDVLPIRSSHNVLSYTLKSPLLQTIKMKKDYFLVPMESILPLNWEKFFDNPVRGDDVLNDVGPTVESFWSKVASSFTALNSAWSTLMNNSSTTEKDAIQITLRFLVLSEYFYSNGSLMASLGCHGAPYLIVEQTSGSVRKSFDWFMDKVLLALRGVMGSGYFTLVIDGYTYTVVAQDQPSGYNRISLRTAVSLVRDNPTAVIGLVSGITGARSAMLGAITGITLTPVAGVVPFNTSRLWAYQLVCSHYYSNDHIDFVYSAELFRQLIGHYLRAVIGVSNFATQMFFTRNGVRYQYDYLSAFCAAKVIDFISTSTNATNLLTTTSTTISNYTGCLGFLSALFAYRRSLRYQDYFTGSRAQPLAVGSTGVTVSGGSVDVVDITRNIQRQRFLNAVNRVRHNFEGYLQGIFGGDVPAPDYHNPFFLAHTDDTVFGAETENTGAAQMSDSIAITSNLRSNGSRYMFEIHADRPCVILGITHYDLARVYCKSVERSFFHVDRFDMFNPFMQFIGDQPVYLQELGTFGTATAMANFAYALRHMEYKQRYNQAAGGFVENLPGFAFLASDERGDQATINPDWIRSVPSEFDNFYVSLTGFSNGSYFHFIVDNYNDCSGSRPMAYAPSIL